MEKKSGWKRFQRLTFSSGEVIKRARRAETATTKHAHKFVLSRLKNLRESRQAILSWLVLVGVIIAAAAGQFVYAFSAITKDTNTEGGTYAEGVVGDIATLNPLFASTEAEISASRLIFSSLYDYDNSGHLREDLARSVTTNKNKTVYHVTIRPDAYWHDGKPVTIDDIVYTVAAMKNPAVRATKAVTWRSIIAEKTSDSTVKFTLPAAYAGFLDALTFPIVPAHILQATLQQNLRQNTFSAMPIGSGPFAAKFLQSQYSPREQKIAYLSANPQYYRGTPKLSRFELHAYQSSDDLRSALVTNDINAAVDTSDIVNELPTRFTTRRQLVNSGVYAIFNTNSPVLTDKTVRTALQLGTDTASLSKRSSAMKTPLDYPIISSQLRNPTLVKKPSLNVQKAGRLLDQAGWKLRGETRYKKKQPLTLKVSYSKSDNYKLVVDTLTEQWKKLGVKIEATAFDPEASTQSFAQSVLQPRAYDVLINELVLDADPDVYAYWHSSQANMLGLNFANYRSDRADDNLATARTSSNQQIRTEKYERFIRQWISDAPAIGLYQSSVLYAGTASTDAFLPKTVTPTRSDRFSNVIYWTAERGRVYTSP